MYYRANTSNDVVATRVLLFEYPKYLSSYKLATSSYSKVLEWSIKAFQQKLTMHFLRVYSGAYSSTVINREGGIEYSVITTVRSTYMYSNKKSTPAVSCSTQFSK